MPSEGVKGKFLIRLAFCFILILCLGCEPNGNSDTGKPDGSADTPDVILEADNQNLQTPDNPARDYFDITTPESTEDLPLGACFDFSQRFEAWHPGENIQFNAICSTGPIATYTWQMEPGVRLELETPVHYYTYSRPGTYTVILTVKGADGTYDTNSQSITIQPASMVTDVTPMGWNYHPKDIALIGGKIYMASGYEGLVVFDVDNPFEPRQISNLLLDGEAVRIAADGNYAAVACLGDGLKIVNISNPAAPVVVGRYRVDDYEVRFVEVSGNYVYAGLGSDYGDHPHPDEPVTDDQPPPPIPGKAVILNIRNPRTPVVVATFNTEVKSVTCTDLTDDYFYFIEGRWLRAVNISNPTSPFVEYDLRLASMFGGPIEDLEVCDGVGYATVNNGNNIKAIDLGVPGELRPMGEVTIQGCRDITIRGNYAVATSSNGIKIIDLSIRGNLRVVTGINILYPVVLQADDEYVYVARLGGLDVVDYRGPGEPQVISTSATFGEPHNPILNGEILYVPDRTVGWHVLDVSDPEHVQVVNRVDIPSVIDYRRAGNNIMYIDEGSFSVCNTDDPENPRIVGSLPLQLYCKGLDYKDLLAYVVIENGKLIIIDVSDPAQPVEIGHLDSSTKFYDIEVVEGYAYVAADEAGLVIVDVTPPGAPKVTGTVPTNRRITEIFSYGNYLVMSSFERNLVIAEITEPGRIRIINQLPNFMSVSGYSVVDDIVYVVENTSYPGGENRIRVIDMSDPLHPELIGPITLTFNADSIIVDRGYAYLTLGYYGGFRIVRLPG